MQSAPPRSKLPKILCVDDEPELLAIMSEVVAQAGFEVLACANVAEATAMVRRHAGRLALVVSDFAMPGGNGFDLRQAMLPDFQDVPFVIVSGQISREQALMAVDLGISGVLAKPWVFDDLTALIARASAGRAASILEDDELRESFVADARAMLDEMEDSVLSLEEDPSNGTALDRLFACAHTIKGSSGFFKPSVVQKFVHRYEDYLSPLKKGEAQVDGSRAQILLRGIDRIRELIVCLDEQREPVDSFEAMVSVFESSANRAPETTAHVELNATRTAALASSTAVNTAAKAEEIRVDAGVLREFSTKSGEITVLRNMVERLLQAVDARHPHDAQIAELGGLFREMNKSVIGIQERVEDMKKVSLQHVIRPLHRTIRDLGGQLGKTLAFEVIGGDLRVDQRLADGLAKSLIHLLRNSADHGIESTERRRAAGKPDVGRITMSFEETNNVVLVRIADDGGGIDLERVRAKAVERGLLSREQAAQLPAPQVRALIFEAGFSTSELVSDVSGRGVGMDMVNRTVSELGGRIDTESELGRGTEFCLRLPIPRAVHIIDALMVKHGEQTFAIPLGEVDQVVDLGTTNGRERLRSMAGRDHYAGDDDVDAIVAIEELTKRSRGKPPGYLVRVCARRASFMIAVDEVIGIEDIVVKALDGVCRNARVFKGATFVADGRVGLVIDVEASAAVAGIGSEHASVVGKKSPSSDRTLRCLSFDTGDGSLYAVAQSEVYRIEMLPREPDQRSGRAIVMPYRDDIIPIVDLRPGPKSATEWPMIVLRDGPRLRGFLVADIGDLIELQTGDGSEGAVIHEGRVVTMARATGLFGEDDLIAPAIIEAASAEEPAALPSAS